MPINRKWISSTRRAHQTSSEYILPSWTFSDSNSEHLPRWKINSTKITSLSFEKCNPRLWAIEYWKIQKLRDDEIIRAKTDTFLSTDFHARNIRSEYLLSATKKGTRIKKGDIFNSLKKQDPCFSFSIGNNNSLLFFDWNNEFRGYTNSKLKSAKSILQITKTRSYTRR